MANSPKDARDFFDVILPEVLKQHPDKAREINVIYFFDITGDGGGEWTVDLLVIPPKITRGNAGDAECSIKIAHDDFMDMLGHPFIVMQLYFEGRLKAQGDPMLITHLETLFDFGD